jgi:hypothetical protein
MSRKAETVKTNNHFVAMCATPLSPKKIKIPSSRNIPPPPVVPKAGRQAAFFDFYKNF